MTTGHIISSYLLVSLQSSETDDIGSIPMSVDSSYNLVVPLTEGQDTIITGDMVAGPTRDCLLLHLLDGFGWRLGCSVLPCCPHVPAVFVFEVPYSLSSKIAVVLEGDTGGDYLAGCTECSLLKFQGDTVALQHSPALVQLHGAHEIILRILRNLLESAFFSLFLMYCFKLPAALLL